MGGKPLKLIFFSELPELFPRITNSKGVLGVPLGTRGRGGQVSRLNRNTPLGVVPHPETLCVRLAQPFCKI